MNLIGIVMGSKSDYPVMKEALIIPERLSIPCEIRVISAHRTPQGMMEYAKKAEERGLKVIVAGAGGAAHLPGMLAALTVLPVIGVPVKSTHSLDGWDSLLSILQMPKGTPVATMAVGAAFNAGLLATQILATNDSKLADSLHAYKKELQELSEDQDKQLRST